MKVVSDTSTLCYLSSKSPGSYPSCSPRSSFHRRSEMSWLIQMLCANG